MPGPHLDLLDLAGLEVDHQLAPRQQRQAPADDAAEDEPEGVDGEFRALTAQAKKGCFINLEAK